MLVTPETKLLRGFGDLELKIVGYSAHYLIRKIAEEMGYDIEDLLVRR